MDDYDESNEVDEEEMFEKLLKTMNIHSYDASIPIALADYARRYTAELLCDAKDFAVHANRSDIEAEDIALATKIGDSGLNRIQHKTRNNIDLAKDINKKSLGDMILEKDKRVGRYSSEFLLRTYTYVPGNVAYAGRNIDANDDMEVEADHIGSHMSSSSSRLAMQRLVNDKFSTVQMTSRGRNILKPATVFPTEEDNSMS